jgi:hypothetical protein
VVSGRENKILYGTKTRKLIRRSVRAGKWIWIWMYLPYTEMQVARTQLLQLYLFCTVCIQLAQDGAWAGVRNKDQHVRIKPMRIDGHCMLGGKGREGRKVDIEIKHVQYLCDK